MHLPIGVLGEADRPGLGDPLQPRGDIDAVAHQIAVALLDDIAEMDADAELDAALGRHARIALDHGVLHFDRTAHRIDHAAELDQRAVAGALDHPAVVHGDGRIDEVAAQRPQPRQGAVLVGAGQAAEADDVRRQNRDELAGFAHHAPIAVGRRLNAARQSRSRRFRAPLRTPKAAAEGRVPQVLSLNTDRPLIHNDLSRNPGSLGLSACEHN